jgi:uncharacterized protein YjiS (DUF1127 family)
MELAHRGSVKNSPTGRAAAIAAIKRSSAVVLGTLVGVARTLPSRLAGLLAAWRQRAEEQRYLGDLNDYYLKDLGLSRGDVAPDETELFWRR